MKTRSVSIALPLLKTGNRLRRSLGQDVPHVLWVLDGKHIAMRKPKRSGSEYCNYNGLFSLVLLALVKAHYRFLWVDVVSSRSSSNAQILNRSKLKEKIGDGSLGLTATAPMGEGEQN